MKTLLFASIITAAAALSCGLPAHAATATETTTSRPVPPGHRMHSPHRMDRPCSYRTVRRHRHGQVVMERVKTCH